MKIKRQKKYLWKHSSSFIRISCRKKSHFLLLPPYLHLLYNIHTLFVHHISCSIQQKHPIFWSNPLCSITVTTICYFYDWLTTLIAASNLIYSTGTLLHSSSRWRKCNNIKYNVFLSILYIDIVAVTSFLDTNMRNLFCVSWIPELEHNKLIIRFKINWTNYSFKIYFCVYTLFQESLGVDIYVKQYYWIWRII